MHSRHLSVAGTIPVVAALLIATPAWTADANGSEESLSEVLVIGVSPLPGAEVDRDKVPAPVQSATAADVARTHALDLTEFMKRSLGGVYVNDTQDNPLQPDVNYRGYTASPLLGTPQGMSVFLDGMRLNQPFGDVVSWDLIPKQAISSMTLMPGSNPIFGLNALGGALSLKTKDGFSDPGYSVGLNYGSHSQRQAEIEAGGHEDSGLYWYGTANKLKDDGWRELSPTDASQVFGKLGWRGDGTDVALSAAYASTDMTGNGLQDMQLLASDYASVYTVPDNTRNKAGLFNLVASHKVSDALTLSGNAYYRHIRTQSFNGDINDDSLGGSFYQPTAAEQTALTNAGYTGFPTTGESQDNTPFPKWRCIAAMLLVGQLKPNGDNVGEPAEKCNGIDTTAHTLMHDSGVAGQLSWVTGSEGLHNLLLGGFSLSRSRAHFTQGSQFGYLNPDRTVGLIACPAGAAGQYCDTFADGTEISDDGDPVDARVDLNGRTSTRSVYASDVLSAGRLADFTVSGRYDHTHVSNLDAITPEDEDGTLTGRHDFSRFNPAVGVTLHPGESVAAYLSYGLGSRAPSAIELGCSDPDNPCRLPNAMAGDPPLKEVVTHSIEAGLRGKATAWLVWNAGVFRADNHNDILFTANTAGFGYYQNVDKTRRQGVELGATGKLGAWSFGANYTYLDATFRSDEEMLGEGNSSNEDGPGFEGTIDVHPGDRMPLIPKQMFKAFVAWQVLPQLSASVDLLSTSDIIARGNENGEHEPDGVYYLGPGKAGGYAVVNLGVDYRPIDSLSLFAQLNNALDHKYYTAAQLGSTGFNAAGDFVGRPFAGPVVDGDRPVTGSTFYSPGAPRAVWFGARYTFSADAR